MKCSSAAAETYESSSVLIFVKDFWVLLIHPLFEEQRTSSESQIDNALCRPPGSTFIPGSTSNTSIEFYSTTFIETPTPSLHRVPFRTYDDCSHNVLDHFTNLNTNWKLDQHANVFALMSFVFFQTFRWLRTNIITCAIVSECWWWTFIRKSNAVFLRTHLYFFFEVKWTQYAKNALIHICFLRQSLASVEALSMRTAAPCMLMDPK